LSCNEDISDSESENKFELDVNLLISTYLKIHTDEKTYCRLRVDAF